MIFKFYSCAFLCAFILFSSSYVKCEATVAADVEIKKKLDNSSSDLNNKNIDDNASLNEDITVNSADLSNESISKLDEALENVGELDVHETDKHTALQANNSNADDYLNKTDIPQKKNTQVIEDSDLKVETKEEGILEIDSDDMVDDSYKEHKNISNSDKDIINPDEKAQEKILEDIVAINANQTERKSITLDDENKTTTKIAEDITSSDALVAVNIEESAPSYDKLVPICDWNRYSADSAITLKQWVRWWKYLRMKQPIVMPWLNGLILRIYPGNEVYRALYVRGIYDPNFIIAVNSLLNRGGTFIDAGANIGHFSLLASEVVGKEGHVIAIEPSSRDYNRLLDNIKINGLENVISPYRFALSDVNEGIAKLSIACEERSALNTIGSEFGVKGVDEVQVEDVSLATLDSFVVNSGLTRVEVLKLDIEGSELKALKGATDTISRFRPAIMIGVNASSLKACGATREEIQKFMRGFRYRMYKITYTPRFEFVLVDDISKNHSKVLFCFHESVIPPSLPQPENKSIIDYTKDFFTK